MFILDNWLRTQISPILQRDTETPLLQGCGFVADPDLCLPSERSIAKNKHSPSGINKIVCKTGMFQDLLS